MQTAVAENSALKLDTTNSAKRHELLAGGFEKIDRDLGFLMECLRETLEELGEGELADHLPWGRAAGVKPLGEASADRLEQVFSIAFQLLNMVEENASAQTRRARESALGLQAESGLWGDQLQRLRDAGWSQQDVAAALRDTHVEPVLTAHPTEAKRATVLEQHRTLYLLLLKRENQMWTPQERDTIRDEIKLAMERLWRTGEILLRKPDVAAERHAQLHYLREVFPAVLPWSDQRLRQAWQSVGWDPKLIAAPDRLPRLTLGTWAGGDRDGHPLVTAEVTREALEGLRLNALIVLDRQLRGLVERLSLSVHAQTPPIPLLDGVTRLASELGDRGAAALKRNPEEPWRQLASLMRLKLPFDPVAARVESLHEQTGYRFAHELRADLELLRESLVAVGATRIAQTDVDTVIRSLDVFGFHLAALDVRQNSKFHDAAMSQLLVAAGIDGGSFAEWPEEKRLELLNAELNSPRPFAHAGVKIGPEADAVLSCYRVLATHIERYGPAGVGSLIVSMTRSLSDLLVVYILAREAGLARPGTTGEGLICRLPVVPLFETVKDLEHSPGIVRAFMAHPVTRRSCSARRADVEQPPTQQIMIGYSDSNKDSGIFASQWNLHKAQHTLAELGRELGFTPRFFHGRGGTVSRGAGPTHRFLEALPVGSISGDVRLTEQGETIAQKYGNHVTAVYNLELLMAGVTGVMLRHRRQKPVLHALAPVAERLSQFSREAYVALWSSEGFHDFYRQATPIDALEHSSIGSRPARRTGTRSLDDLRAIPWVFSWQQCRFYLPGWFGVGSALHRLSTEHPAEFDALTDQIGEWSFIRYVLNNVETSVASTDVNIMTRYAELVGDPALRGRLFEVILDELARTQTMMTRVFGAPLRDRRPRMAKTLRLREEALRVLHEQQITLLRGWREAKARDDVDSADKLLPQVLLSVNAIASGLRTTG